MRVQSAQHVRVQTLEVGASKDKDLMQCVGGKENDRGLVWGKDNELIVKLVEMEARDKAGCPSSGVQGGCR